MSKEEIKTPSQDGDDEEKKKPVLVEKGEVGEFVKTAVFAIVIALVIRSLLFEPFNIPSGSMKPTLQVGDYLFVNKPAYGYSRYSFPFGFAPIENRVMGAEPKRGDVVVFALPSNTRIDYIKRVIGLPGENIMVRSGKLYINGEKVPREFVQELELEQEDGSIKFFTEYTETLPNGAQHAIYEESDYEQMDDTDVYKVPEGHYFVMGDNRDNSTDSRYRNRVGFIPLRNIVGRADFLFFSTNGYAQLLEIWKWPWSIRYSRFFMDIDPEMASNKTKE